VASRGDRLVTGAPGRLWEPPAGHHDPAARSIAVRPPGDNPGDGSAAHGRKSPRWSAERRASPIARGRGTPRKRPGVPIARHARGVSRQRVHARVDALRTPRRLGAPLAPRFGSGHQRIRNAPGANAPRERKMLFGWVEQDDSRIEGAARRRGCPGGLFDIVRQECGAPRASVPPIAPRSPPTSPSTRPAAPRHRCPRPPTPARPVPWHARRRAPGRQGRGTWPASRRRRAERCASRAPRRPGV
jgi:hypothetical protein